MLQLDHQCALCDQQQNFPITNPRIERQTLTKKQKDGPASTTVINRDTQLDDKESDHFKTLAIAQEKFPCLRAEIRSLITEKSLPKVKELNISRKQKRYLPNRDNLLRLCFLTTLREKSDKIPFTKEEARIFLKSRMAEEKTSNWLGWRGMLTFVVLGGCAAAINYVGLITLIQSNIEGNETTSDNSTLASTQAVSQPVASSMAFAGAFVFGVITNFSGLWWTGRNPDNSSIKANEQQNRINLLYREYLNLSYELISLYYDKEFHPLAKAIAKEINVNLIANILNDATDNEYASELVGIENLLSVINFIETDGQYLPMDKELQRYIESIEQKH